MKTAILLLPAALAGAGFAARFARGVLHHRDADRRAAERAAYEERRQAEKHRKSQAAVEEIVERYFPFARAEFIEGKKLNDDPRERLRRILHSVPGISLGISSLGFHAILPLAERRKHLLGLGKSGYGKTTVALRLILD